MKTFILRVSFFAVIVCVVFAGVEFGLRFVNDPYKYKHDYLLRHLDDIKIMSLGHSHIADAINMLVIADSGFNAAISGRNMFYDAEIVEEFVPKMSNLKTIIMPLGYNFQYRNVTGIDVQQKCLMAKYWGYDLPGDSPLIRLECLYGSKNKIADFLMGKRNFELYDSLGHQRLPKSSGKDLDDVDLKVLNPPICDIHPFVTEIKRIARVCRRFGVRLIAVTTPCYKTYVQHTTPQGIAALHALADSMRIEYPEMEYYDFMCDSRFDKEDFFNSSHLNELGALKFSAIMKDEILPNPPFRNSPE